MESILLKGKGEQSTRVTNSFGISFIHTQIFQFYIPPAVEAVLEGI